MNLTKLLFEPIYVMKFKKSLFDKQIDVFIAWCIRQGNREGTHNFWLREFGKKFRGNAYEIEQGDIDNFLTDVSVLYNGQHALDQAERSLKSIVRYYSARGRNVPKGSLLYKRKQIIIE